MARKPRLVPEFFVSSRNTIIQILFTTVFAYFFINVYQPFGSKDWYAVSFWVFSLVSGLIVIAGMLVVLASRLIMFAVKRYRPITVWYYAIMIASEIIMKGAMYTVVERLALVDETPFFKALVIAVQNTSLILLIPYLISTLFFAWWEKKVSLETLIRQLRYKPQFIPFKDENESLKLSIKSYDLLYLEANDNYVTIHYKSGDNLKKFTLRNTLKNIEKQMEDYPLLRCHRSFMVNIDQVKMLKREYSQFNLWLDEAGTVSIPVSRSFVLPVSEVMSKLRPWR
ncbi:MAG TPA: LytTR family DNA-binding domain-containing protein [Bacteroidales bacterium]|nr:LytTR family DNA-binding domain-containing protein [Bacteroidales bacterium]